MTLESMTPDPGWDAAEHEETVETFAGLGEEFAFKVWGGDWCPDCRNQLPAFAAALAAAGIDPVEDVEHYAVEKDGEGGKVGPRVDEYGIELIPTVVVERDGEEVARFVEEADVPIAAYLARRLDEVEASA